MNPILRWSFFFTLTVGLGQAAEANPLASAVFGVKPQIPSSVPRPVEQGRHFNVAIRGLSNINPMLTHSAFSLGGGWVWQHLGFDFRWSYHSANFEEIYAEPNSEGFEFNPPTAPSFTEPTSEFNRVRSGGDRWSLMMFEPGVLIQGKLFADLLPLWSQYARVGLSYCILTDQTNSLGFTGWTLGYEAGMQYQLGKNSPFAVEAAIVMRHGRAKLNEASNTGYLGLWWFQTSVGLLWWF